LQRMRELALQSANGSYGSDERKAMQSEFSQLTSELNRIAETTSFGSKKLLDGSFGSTAFQVGANAYETINLTMNSVAASKIGTNQVASVAVAPSAAGAAAVNYTIRSGADEAVINAGAGESAKSVAAKMNGAVPGVSATARTVATLAFTDVAAADAVSFDLKVGDVTAKFSGIYTQDELFKQLSDNASALNISVDVENKTITSTTGENLEFNNAAGAGLTTFMVTSQGADGTPGTAAQVVGGGFIVSGSIQLD